MKVSIIIPVYNVEKYLKKCVESVCAQDYKDLEIILVDDGATDSSGIMCDRFAEIDTRIKVVHKENGGLSSARNAGVAVATGDFVTYLDSDDFISKRYVSRLLGLAIEKNADIAITPLIYCAEHVNEEVDTGRDGLVLEMTAEEAIAESLYQTHFSCNAPAKMFKREIAQAVEFPLGLVSEDLATCHLFLHKANKVVFVNEDLYFYRQQEKSIMHVFNEKRMDSLKNALKVETFCNEVYPQLVEASKCRVFNVATHLVLDLLEISGYEDMKKVIWKEIKRTRWNVILSSRTRIRDKAAAVLSMFGETALKIVWNSKLSVKQKIND